MIDKYNFIDSLNRDRARGNLAPHQLILLISFFKLKKDSLTIDELIVEFDNNWQVYKQLFKSTNKNIGMPLQAMLNKGLISIGTSGFISNFRSREEVVNKVNIVVIERELKGFLNEANLSDLIDRITS